MRQIEGSLERLRVDRIDAYLAHEFDPSTRITDVFNTFEELIERDLIASYGVSNFSAAQLASALEVGRPAVIQNSYSLFNRKDESELIPLALQHGVEYQAYSPLAGGWLSGKYRPNQPLSPDSRLALAPQWYAHIDPKRAYEGLAVMEKIALENQTTVASLAYGWVLAQGHVAGIVVGPRRLEHFEPIWDAYNKEAQPIVKARLSAVTV
jgi:aryl-alcohol dehydrogenase-like predicted oxidoreductase